MAFFKVVVDGDGDDDDVGDVANDSDEPVDVDGSLAGLLDGNIAAFDDVDVECVFGNDGSVGFGDDGSVGFGGPEALVVGFLVFFDGGEDADCPRRCCMMGDLGGRFEERLALVRIDPDDGPPPRAS